MNNDLHSYKSIEVKIERKRFLIIAGAALITFLLILFTIISRFNNAEDDKPVIADITLCDVDNSGLCIVTFGANDLDRMVINFQLPGEDYPVFYIKASNRGIVNVYSCEVVEDISTSVNCTGSRTPLGEAIEIEVYTTDGDILIARGEFIVSAILLSTSENLTEGVESETDTPTVEPSPTEAIIPTETESTPTLEEDVSVTETIIPTETETTLTPEEDTPTPTPTLETVSPTP